LEGFDKRSIGLDGVQVAANVEFAAAIPLNGLRRYLRNFKQFIENGITTAKH
jgi:hypothetical protein